MPTSSGLDGPDVMRVTASTLQVDTNLAETHNREGAGGCKAELQPAVWCNLEGVMGCTVGSLVLR